MKPAIKKILYNDFFPFILLAVFMLIYHFFLPGRIRDDIFYSHVLNDMTLLTYLKNMWLTWTSRLFIEAVAVTMTMIPMFIWLLLNIVIYTGMGVSISRLLITKNRRYMNCVIACMMLIYTFSDMGSAGWIVTTTTYLWPLAFGLLTVFSIKKCMEGQKIKWYEYLVYLLLLLFSANLEQMAIALTAVYLFAFIYLVWKKMPVRFVFIELMACIGSILFMLLCPGNNLRTINEIQQGFADYGSLNFFNKVELGYSSTLYHLIINGNFLFFIFCTILAVSVFARYVDIRKRIMGCIPLLFWCVLGYGRAIAERIFDVKILSDQLTDYGTITSENYRNISSYVPMILLGITCFTALISIYYLYGKTIKSMAVIYLILTGFATRLAMGFSPTIWRSGPRTYLVMLFTIVIISCLILHDNYEKISKKYGPALLKLFLLGCFALAMICYVKDISLVRMMQG